MKYVPVMLILGSMALTLFIVIEMTTGRNWFDLWVLFPFIVPMIFGISHLVGRVQSQIIPIAGAITSVVALPPYYSAYTYNGTDGQVGLIFAVMPVYQIVGLLVISGIGYITMHFSRRNKLRG